MRNAIIAAFALLAACSPPETEPSAPARDPNAPYEPPLVQMAGERSPEIAEAAADGFGKWTRRTGACPATITFVPATDAGVVYRSESDDWVLLGPLLRTPATRIVGEPNELRWATEAGDVRFAWLGEYASMIGPGERRCEYSRGFVWGERSPLLP